MFFSSLTIPQAFRQVKFKSKNVAVWFCALAMTLTGACQSSGPYHGDRRDFSIQKIEAHPHYLAASLPYEPAAKMRKEVEEKEGLALKNRGEAHITVITPPEFDILKKHLSSSEIEQIAQSDRPQQLDLEIVCLGKGQAAPDMVTYFLVVKSKSLLKIRQKIEKVWQAKGGTSRFQAAHFFPHITLGFTHRDLHEADGVFKDERSCISDVSTR